MIYDREKREQDEMTRRKRTYRLELTDTEAESLKSYAKRAGLSISELIAAFVYDLTDSSRSHGSDERDLADSWYYRCGFGYEGEDE